MCGFDARNWKAKVKAISVESLIKMRNTPRETLEKMVIGAADCMSKADNLADAVKTFLSKPRGANDVRELQRALAAYEKVKFHED